VNESTEQSVGRPVATEPGSTRHIAVIQTDTPSRLITTVKWLRAYKTYTKALLLA